MIDRNIKTKVAKVLRGATDVLLAIALISLMSTAIVEDEAHEWIGIAVFVLAVVHLALNHRFVRLLHRGKYVSIRVLHTCLDALLVLCIACLIVSSLVLSRYAFGWLPPLSGISWARPLHLIASYWFFLIAFIHAGTHIGPSIMGRSPAHIAIRAIICMLLLAAGSAAFLILGISDYLLLGSQFVYIDPDISVAGYAGLYALVASGAIVIGHVIRCVMTRKRPSTSSR